MPTCCFFGHHDASNKKRDAICQTVKQLIEKEKASFFLVGTHGNFDYMVLSVLREIKKDYPQIKYAVVLAYMPDRPAEEYSYFKPEESLFPDGMEKVPRKYGILWRNDWMLTQSDIVVCYMQHHFGGTGRMIEKAEKQHKRIINLFTNSQNEI